VRGAVIEGTEPPHTGCAEFVTRFGADAMGFVNSETGPAAAAPGAIDNRTITAFPRGGTVVSALRTIG
jgi:hypothetical protein